MSLVTKLADAFPRPTEADWTAAAAKARRNAPVADAATTGLHPRRSGAYAINARPAGTRWTVVDRISAPSAAALLSAADRSFANGADGIEIAIRSGLHPAASQLNDSAADDIAASLAIPEGATLRIDATEHSTLDAFIELAAARRLHLAFTLDPAAVRALGRGADGADIVRLAQKFASLGVNGDVVCADGRLWNAGGANEEQELGAVLSSFVAAIRTLDSSERIGITLAADPDQFRTIAKFRAMRLLLGRIIEVGSLPNIRHAIHAETSWRATGAREPEVNLLRTTAGAFAAAVGGCDSMTVLAHDAAAGEEAPSAARLARNTQLILAAESHLAQVADPAAGSGAIEMLTDTFAEAAWRRFQSIEAEGGIAGAIEEGSLLREIAETRETRITRVARGETTLIGVNAYRDDGESPTLRLPVVKRTGPLLFRRPAEAIEVRS